MASAAATIRAKAIKKRLVHKKTRANGKKESKAID